MKKLNLLNIIILLFLVFLSFSCNDEKNNPVNEGNIEFSINKPESIFTNTIKSSSIDHSEIAFVIVTISNLNGEIIHNKLKIELYNMNGYFISSPISLNTGEYYLTEFFVADDSDNILYSAPKQNSKNSTLVTSPLPIYFEITKDNITKITPEIISVEYSSPEDFGYTSFSLNFVETSGFYLSVFSYNEQKQNFEFIDAFLTIIADSKTIFSDNIAAITNMITISDEYSNYKIIIEKPGYVKYEKLYTKEELKSNFEKLAPLIIIIENDETEPQNLAGLHWHPTFFEIVRINYLTNESAFDPKIQGIEGFVTGSSTYDFINNKYIVVGLANKGKPNEKEIMVIDPITAIIEKKIKVENNLGELEYSGENDLIYGLSWQNTSFKIAKIDLSAASIQYSPIINNLNAFVAGSSTFDKENNKYLVIGTSSISSSLNKIMIIDPETGVIEKTIELPGNTGELEYNSKNNKIYALYWQGTNFKIATIDYNSGSIVYSPVIEGLKIFEVGSSTLNYVNNLYMIIGYSDEYNLVREIKIITPETGIIERTIDVNKAYPVGEIEFY